MPDKLNLFFRTDNAGRRKPTFLFLVLLCFFVFLIAVMSQNKKPHTKHKSKQLLIKSKDIVEAANNPLNRQSKAFDFNYNDILTPTDPQQSKDLRPSAMPMKKPFSSLNTKAIVFDNTKDYTSKSVVPLGSMVKCLLIHNIVTNNFEAPVIVQLWEDFYFNGKLLLPFGTRVYGTASSGRERDRVIVRFHDIVFQNGKTISIHAMALSQDGSGGLTGTVIDDRNKRTFVSMAMNLLSGIALGFQQSTTNALTGINEVGTSSRNAVLNGVANSLQREAEHVQRDAESAKGYAIVLAGQEMLVYFENKADVQSL